MENLFPLYILEQCKEMEITCQTIDRTQYKGILLQMYRNLDCMLGKTQVKYLGSSTPIEKPSVFIRGTKIALFILPPLPLQDIAKELEEKLTKQKDSKPSKSKGKSKGKNKSKTSSRTQDEGKKRHRGSQRSPISHRTQQYITQRAQYSSVSHGYASQTAGYESGPTASQYQNPYEPIQGFEPSSSTLPQHSSHFNVLHWQPQPAYENYQQQPPWVYGTGYPPNQANESYPQQYVCPYPLPQIQQVNLPPTLVPAVQFHPTQQAPTFQIPDPRSVRTLVRCPPYYQPPFNVLQQTQQMQVPQPFIPSAVYQQTYPPMPPHQRQEPQQPIYIPYGHLYPTTQSYQMPQPQHPDPNVYHQTYQMQQMQYPTPNVNVPTYPPTRSFPEQQLQHSDPNARQQDYPTTRSSRLP